MPGRAPQTFIREGAPKNISLPCPSTVLTLSSKCNWLLDVRPRFISAQMFLFCRFTTFLIFWAQNVTMDCKMSHAKVSQTFQGFVITLPYCFLNTEVRSILTHHWNRWQANRNFESTSNGRRRRDGRGKVQLSNYFRLKLNCLNLRDRFKQVR